MMSVKGNKKMIQQHIQEKSAKVVTLKDLQNISDRMKDRLVISVNGFVDEIRKIDGKEYNLVRVVITKLKKQLAIWNKWSIFNDILKSFTKYTCMCYFKAFTYTIR